MTSVFYKETPEGMERAEIVQTNNQSFTIKYFAFDGAPLSEETITGKTLEFVESKAEDWALGYSYIKG